MGNIVSTQTASSAQLISAHNAKTHWQTKPSLWSLFAVCCIMVLTFASPMSHAKTKPAKTQPSHQAALLMSLSDLNRQMDTLSGTLISALQSSGRQTVAIPASLIATLTEAVQVSFGADALKRNLLTLIDQGLSQDDIEILLQWYDSDLGNKIIRLEAQAASQEGLNSMLRQASQHLNDQRVLPYAKRIDNIIGATDFTIRLQNLTQRAIFEASSKGLNPQDPVNVSHFDQQWTQQTQQIRAATNQLVMLNFAYAYQSLTNEELERYAQFLASPAGTKFNKVATQSIEHLFKRATAQMVEYVVQKPQKDPLAY